MAVLTELMLDPSFEQILAQEQSSFRCEHLVCDTFENEHPWHFHPAFELTWIIQSEGMRYVGDSIDPYYPDDLVLCGPNLPHCWRDDACRSGARGPEWIIAQFDPKCFGEGFIELPEAHAIRSLLDDAQFGVSFSLEAVKETRHLLHEIVQRTGMARLIGLIDILERLSRYERKRLAGHGYHRANQVDQNLVDRLELVQIYIKRNLNEEISQKKIAEQMGFTASGFSKFFRAATGTNFMSLVKILRIQEACRLLAVGSDRITDIALSCGYQHTSHFDQHFREIKGMAPSEYRRLMQSFASQALHQSSPDP